MKHFRCLPKLNSRDGVVGETFIRRTGITLDEATQLVSKTKARPKQDELNMFDWDLTDRDQGISDTKMMVFLWFKEEVTPKVRKKVLSDIQQGLTMQPLEFKNVHVRATLELDRPWKKAQSIFLGVAKLPCETFDIRWVHLGLRVSVAVPTGRTAVPTPLASFTTGTTRELYLERFRKFAHMWS